MHRGGAAPGAVGKARGMLLTPLEGCEADEVAEAFGISTAMAAEIMFCNDELGEFDETPEQRHARMYFWISANIKKDAS